MRGEESRQWVGRERSGSSRGLGCRWLLVEQILQRKEMRFNGTTNQATPQPQVISVSRQHSVALTVRSIYISYLQSIQHLTYVICDP